MIEYTGSSLEEIVASASKDLGCKPEEVITLVKPQEEGATQVVAVAYCMNDVKEFLFDYLGNFFTSIGQDIEVSIEQKNEGFVVNLNSENNAVLIGKMGKTLAAFNTVVRGAVNAQFRKRFDILIDINHYKEDRYSKVESIAKRVAKQVESTKVEAALDPMPNDERKAIHQALNDWEHIKTDSAGEGPTRHIVIRYVESKEDTPSEEE